MGKSIALFGTSADPPTIGHKKILEELSKIYSMTIGYVSNNPNKNHKEDISIRSHLLKRSILFKIIIIFFPCLIKELILFNSFLFISPATTNKIRSE